MTAESAVADWWNTMNSQPLSPGQLEMTTKVNIVYELK